MDAIAIKDTPLLMKPEMVRATLREVDPKTMTRRIIKLPDIPTRLGQWEPTTIGGKGVYRKNSRGDKIPVEEEVAIWHTQTGKLLACPYGKPGDRLWVRETHYMFGYWMKKGRTATDKQKWRFFPYYNEVRYFDNPPEDIKPNSFKVSGARFDQMGWYKRVSIHMPRWASRINLEITDIRVERVQDISGEDAKAEGCPLYIGITRNGPPMGNDTYTWFARLWDSINAKRGHGWVKNDWVWVITFRRIADE